MHAQGALYGFLRRVVALAFEHLTLFAQQRRLFGVPALRKIEIDEAVDQVEG